MNIWSKMINALKGEDGDEVSNERAIRILEKELATAAEELRKSKDALTELVSNKKQTEAAIISIQKNIETHEHYAKQALEKKDEKLALDVAEKIVEFETPNFLGSK